MGKVEIDERELHSLKDRAHLFDLIMDAPCYISFFTGHDGQGAALRQTLIVPNRHHMDNTLYNMAMRRAKKLGASSWCTFKPVGRPFNVDYGRYGDEGRLDFIEQTAPLWADDAVTDLPTERPKANKGQTEAQNNA